MVCSKKTEINEIIRIKHNSVLSLEISEFSYLGIIITQDGRSTRDIYKDENSTGKNRI